MNLQENIKRILREELELSSYFRRRIDMETLEQIYQYVLKVVSKKYADNKKHLKAMTPNKFNQLVTSNLIEDVCENFELEFGEDDNRFTQLWDFLSNYYSKRNIKHFYDIRLNKNNSRLKFDIQKLVDDRIIFVTEPGDGQGGVTKPNWEGDCSVITLLNLTDEELELNPWRREAIDKPFPECIPYVQDRQSDWDKEKYQQVIDSIEIRGGEIDNYTI